MAACLTILSYMATAVISASEAMHYVHALVPGFTVIPATIGLLAAFMVLSIIGITESSKVAILIFITHMVTLTILAAAGLLCLSQEGTGILTANLTCPQKGGSKTPYSLALPPLCSAYPDLKARQTLWKSRRENVFPKNP